MWSGGWGANGCFVSALTVGNFPNIGRHAELNLFAVFGGAYTNRSLLIAKGSTAAFTKSLPIVIMLQSLSVSSLFALLVTPVLSWMFLKPRSSKADFQAERLGSKLARWIAPGCHG